MNEDRNEMQRTLDARALRRTVLPLVLIVGGMTGLSLADVPLYDRV